MRLLTIAALLLFSSCDTDLKLGKTDEIFIIKKDQHRSALAFRPFEGNVLKFDARLNETAKYSTANPANQSDINKLLGFSDCDSYHHVNSARFGWRWLNNKLEILAYVYDDGRRKYEFVTSVPLNKMVSYEIRKDADGYFFIVDNKSKVKIKTSGPCSGTADEILWPYFGGDEKAPHDIQLEIKNIVIDSEISL